MSGPGSTAYALKDGSKESPKFDAETGKLSSPKNATSPQSPNQNWLIREFSG
jgi:hypothetical protein